MSVDTWKVALAFVTSGRVAVVTAHSTVLASLECFALSDGWEPVTAPQSTPEGAEIATNAAFKTALMSPVKVIFTPRRWY